MEFEISQKLNRCLYEMGVQPTEITDAAHLSKDLSLDSLDITDLLVRLESEFDVSIPDSEWNNLQTIGQIKSFLATHSPILA